MKDYDVFYNKFCNTRFKLPTEEQVKSIEERFKSQIPEQYRNFILNYNGGYFKNAKFKAKGKENFLHLLFGVTPEDKSSDLVRGVYLFDDNDPVSLLPIGVTDIGDLLFIMIGDVEDGEIGLKIAFSDEYFQLAPDFKSFIKSIYKGNQNMGAT